MKIPLGTIVRDLVTDLVGVAENRTEFMYGCDRYWIQPQVGKDGKVPEGYMVDEPQLKPVEGRDPVMPPPDEPDRIFEMGQHVRDPIMGAEGIITGRAVYLNGCARVFICPKQSSDKDLSPWWIDEEQPISLKEKHSSPSSKQKNTGGPAPSCSKY